jgi:small subunit ribosomal protein S9
MTFPFLIKSVGRRKKAVANVSLFPGSSQIEVNGRLSKSFFVSHPSRFLVVQSPFVISTHINLDVKSNVCGGGFVGQSNALQLALARVVVSRRQRYTKIFRENHFLTSDGRKKERRKYGLKKARKAPQFSKR